MQAVILAYHSHHMEGAGYASNDHVALAQDLELIVASGFDIVPLGELVDAFDMMKQDGKAAGGRARRLVAITFDDGPEYDAVDYRHPTLGLQRSFLRILEDFSRSGPGRARACATSFVIASPEARTAMESLTGAGPYSLHSGAMNDRWWSSAIDSGYLSIANHSWDHLHPGLARVAHSRQARADFSQVDNVADADAQVLAAQRYIDERTGGRAAPFFAYPFGQYNAFLTGEYFASNTAQLGLRAAFTVDGRPVRTHEDVWTLPRYSCGYNWTTPAQLLEILKAA